MRQWVVGHAAQGSAVRGFGKASLLLICNRNTWHVRVDTVSSILYNRARFLQKNHSRADFCESKVNIKFLFNSLINIKGNYNDIITILIIIIIIIITIIIILYLNPNINMSWLLFIIIVLLYVGNYNIIRRSCNDARWGNW